MMIGTRWVETETNNDNRGPQGSWPVNFSTYQHTMTSEWIGDHHRGRAQEFIQTMPIPMRDDDRQRGA